MKNTAESNPPVGFLETLQTVKRILEVTERVLNLFQNQGMNEWLGKVEKAIDQLEQAKSSDEKFAAARALVGLARNLN